MRLKIGFLLEKLQDWLPKAQAEFEAQAAELEAQVQNQDLATLAQEQVITLLQKINSLSAPICYQQTVKSKLSEAIARWQSELNAPNSLAVLGSPIDNFSSIFQAVLANWEDHEYIVECKSLSWSNRPPDYGDIEAQLKSEIDSFVADNTEHRPIIIIIPDLSWCFLRCVDGLATMEYLQSLLWQNQSIFWLIGCNTWAWTYLNIVASLKHYLPQTLHLPELNELELQEWLTPVAEAIEFDFAHRRDFNPELNNHDQEEEDWESASQRNYFEHLAKISLGLAPVASRLWLLSLGIEKEENQSEDENDNDEESDYSPTPQVILQKVTLPDFPKLTKEENYLLFSLGLHGKMNLSELAISLGEEAIKVQHQLQMLSDFGMIERQNDFCQINPAYYPQLKRHLINNNFLVEGEL